MGQNGQTDKREFQATTNFEEIDNLKNPLHGRVKEQLENLKTNVIQESFFEIKKDESGKDYIKYNTNSIIDYLNQTKDKVKNLNGIRNLNNSAAYIMCIQIGLEACGYEVGQIDGILSSKEGTEKSQTEKAIIQFKKNLHKANPNIHINGIPDASIIPHLINGLEQYNNGLELDELRSQISKVREVTATDFTNITDINENKIDISQKPIEIKNTLNFHKEIQNDPDFKKVNPKNLGSRENGEFKFNKTTSTETKNGKTRTYIEISDKLKCEYKTGNGYIDFFYYTGGNDNLTSYNGIRYFNNGDTCKGVFDDITETGKYMIKSGFKKGFYMELNNNDIKLTCHNDQSISLTIPQGKIQSFMNDLKEYSLQPQTVDFTLDGNIIKKVIGGDKIDVHNVDFNKKYGLSNEELLNIVKFLNIKT